MKSLVLYDGNNKFLDFVDGVIMPLKGYSVSYINKYDLSRIEEFIKNNNGKEVFVVINRNLFNRDIEYLNDILIELDRIGITGLFYYDLSILSVYRKGCFKFELIWNQTHMVTNYNTINYYMDKGVGGCVIANEITLEEILEIRNKTDAKLFVNVVTCPIMSFSRRKLLSNYCKGVNEKLKSNRLEISESSTGYRCVVLEEEDGTSMFSSKIVNNVDVVDTYLENNIDYVIIDTNLLNEEVSNNSIYTVYSIINNLKEKDMLIKNLKDEIGGNTGFLYRKTIYKVK